MVLVTVTDEDTEGGLVTVRTPHVIKVQPLDIILSQWEIMDTPRMVAIISDSTPPGR